MILSENFTLTKYGLQVRLVQVEDAAFILSLRADPIRTQYMLTLEADVEKQQQWILAYKKRERAGKDYYLLYSDENNQPVGVNRIQKIDFNKKTCTISSTIKKKGGATTAAAMYLINRFIVFDLLYLNEFYAEYHVDNIKNRKYLEFFDYTHHKTENNFKLISISRHQHLRGEINFYNQFINQAPLTYKGKKLLIIGGKPIATLDIIKYAKSKGAYIIVTDFLEIEDSIGKQWADEYWNISTADVNEICERAVKASVDAVFTGIQEFNLLRTSEICQQLQLPFYATKEQLLSTSEKQRYKQLFRDFGIQVVEEYHLNDAYEEVNNKTIEYPVVTKPVDNGGSFGSSICHNQEELIAGYQKALGASKTKKIIIEKKIDADHVNVYYLIINGEIHYVTSADRHIGYGDEHTVPLPTIITYPSRFQEQYLATTNEKMIPALKSLGVKNGIAFIQMFRDNAGFAPYDMGLRLSGSLENYLFEELCGFNTLNLLVDHAFTGAPFPTLIKKQIDPWLKGKSAYTVSFSVKPCTIGTFINLDQIIALPYVKHVHKVSYPGCMIPETSIGTLHQIAIRVQGVANSQEEMIEQLNHIQELIDIVSDKGVSVLMPRIDYESYFR